MARKTISTWELHVEKGVLGLAAAVLLGGIGYFWLFGGPYATSWPDGTTAGPADVGNRTREVAESVANNFKNPGPPPPHDKTKLSGVAPAIDLKFGTKEYADLQKTLP